MSTIQDMYSVRVRYVGDVKNTNLADLLEYIIISHESVELRNSSIGYKTQKPPMDRGPRPKIKKYPLCETRKDRDFLGTIFAAERYTAPNEDLGEK